MAFDTSSISIVKQGTWLYAGSIECDMCIQYSPIRFGSGDCEDPPEIYNDVEVDTYYLWFGSTTERGQPNGVVGGGAGFSSIAEATNYAENIPGYGASIRWKD
jgi:hypothetical protein